MKFESLGLVVMLSVHTGVLSIKMCPKKKAAAAQRKALWDMRVYKVY